MPEEQRWTGKAGEVKEHDLIWESETPVLRTERRRMNGADTRIGEWKIRIWTEERKTPYSFGEDDPVQIMRVVPTADEVAESRLGEWKEKIEKEISQAKKAFLLFVADMDEHYRDRLASGAHIYSNAVKQQLIGDLWAEVVEHLYMLDGVSMGDASILGAPKYYEDNMRKWIDDHVAEDGHAATLEKLEAGVESAAMDAVRMLLQRSGSTSDRMRAALKDDQEETVRDWLRELTYMGGRFAREKNVINLYSLTNGARMHVTGW